MEEYIIKNGKKLRLGYTTGSCAAAAAKAAAYTLITGRKKERIKLITPKGITLDLNVSDMQIGECFVSCAIQKDSGDDPDITDKALIYAKVSMSKGSGIEIDGGIGVGRVTKKGLDRDVGCAAINSVPLKMIKENLEEVCRITDYDGGLKVEIYVPRGEELARKTFNPRLGIVGGISILGTSGIVEPMSDNALIETIRTEIRQRKAEGDEYLLLTPGNYGADFIKRNFPKAAGKEVLMSNFIGEALDIARELKFKRVLLLGHIGKFIKISGGMFNTHSEYGDCRMEIIAAYAAASGICGDAANEILDCAVCDDAVRILKENGVYEKTFEKISEKIKFMLNHKTNEEIETDFIMFSNKYGIICKSKNAARFLQSAALE